MTLTRADKAVYWLYWLLGHTSGVFTYDWVADWNYYLQQRRAGLTPWKAYTGL